MTKFYVIAGALALTACYEDRPTPLPGPPQACEPSRAQFAVGRNAGPRVVNQAQRRSGAATVRVIGPNDAVTMDFRPDRLNLETNARGRIVRVRCG